MNYATNPELHTVLHGESCGCLDAMLPDPPRTDDHCWPFPCRDYHETYAHRSGEDPCNCPCHAQPKGA